MINWLKRANGLNPQFRKVCGFQPVYAADSNMMNIILQETNTADAFDIIYSSKQIEIYNFRVLRQDSFIKIYDIRYIASLVGYEAWLVISGIIPVNRDTQLNPQIKEAKKRLVKAIYDQWGIDIRKKQ